MADGDPVPPAPEPPAPPPQDPAGGWLDKINQRILVLGAVATGVVGLGSQLNSCADQKVQRYGAFRTAVTAEETFWKDRLDDYVAIAAEEKDTVRGRKERALYALAAHGVPSFAEYNIAMIDGRDEVSLARKRLEQMKKDLAAALATSDDPAVAVPAKAALAFDDTQAALAARTGDDAKPPAPVTTEKPVPLPRKDPSDVPNPNTQTLVVGNPKGWDVDVFWCAGGTPVTEASNYATARAAALTLAEWSRTGSNIGGSVFLGQIRLRALPLLRQGGGYPGPGSNFTVRAEDDPAEQEAAKAVISKLGASFLLASSSTPTKWYLSVFVCRANRAPTTAAAQPPSGNRAIGS